MTHYMIKTGLINSLSVVRCCFICVTIVTPCVLTLFGQDCLQSFTEESDVKYKTFYLTEKRKPRDLPTSSDPASPKVKKKRESENSTVSKVAHSMIFDYSP